MLSHTHGQHSHLHVDVFHAGVSDCYYCFNIIIFVIVIVIVIVIIVLTLLLLILLVLLLLLSFWCCGCVGNGFQIGRQRLLGCVDIAIDTLDDRRVTCDVWRVTCDVWCVTCDVWRVTCDVWRVTCDVWRAMCDVFLCSLFLCSVWRATTNLQPLPHAHFHFQCRTLRHKMVGTRHAPRTPNPKPQTLNPKP